jgi:hypothetical protein
MMEDERSEGETRFPAQQAQQPPTASGLRDQNSAPQASQTGGAGEANSGEIEDSAIVQLDDARISAGVVKLYEALLKEPIPEKMLRLVEELSKQERK